MNSEFSDEKYHLLREEIFPEIKKLSKLPIKAKIKQLKALQDEYRDFPAEIKKDAVSFIETGRHFKYKKIPLLLEFLRYEIRAEIDGIVNEKYSSKIDEKIAKVQVKYSSHTEEEMAKVHQKPNPICCKVHSCAVVYAWRGENMPSLFIYVKFKDMDEFLCTPVLHHDSKLASINEKLNELLKDVFEDIEKETGIPVGNYSLECRAKSSFAVYKEHIGKSDYNYWQKESSLKKLKVRFS